MAIIKKFRNGRPIDPTDPTQNIIPFLVKPRPPSPNINVPPPSSTPKRGGCGCGRK